MDIIRKYKQLPSTRKLKDKGFLYRGQFPTQREFQGVLHMGVDIEYRFQRMTPEAFTKNRELLLRTAHEEGARYGTVPNAMVYAEIEVEISGKTTPKKDKLLRSYSAALHPDAEIMVYGPGYTLPEGAKETFLYHIVDLIADIPRKYSDKFKNATYKVLKMRIGIREPKVGWEELKRAGSGEKIKELAAL